MVKEHEIIADRLTAIKHAVISASTGDIVAIIGKGPERYIISNGVYSPFDEAEIVHSALKERM
jgi:UDP-N-acetylmuramoyl-L-alanyl-D-glutamate--2,6-diaminopimelate ligase